MFHDEMKRIVTVNYNYYSLLRRVDMKWKPNFRS